MSYSFDANILLFASDRSSPQYAAASQFLADRARDPDVFYVGWPTLMAYVRIATHPGVFAAPPAPTDALGNVERLLRLPRVRVLGESDGFLEVYQEVTQGMAVRGNGVPDAHLAALLRQHGVRTLYTADADFRRFAFLDVRNPLT